MEKKRPSGRLLAKSKQAPKDEAQWVDLATLWRNQWDSGDNVQFNDVDYIVLKDGRRVAVADYWFNIGAAAPKTKTSGRPHTSTAKQLAWKAWNQKASKG